MNIYPNDNEEINKEDPEDIHVPFDGFVNVNDLIRDRRNLKATVNNADPGNNIGIDSAE